MASLRVGFEFDDKTFFNMTTTETVWETLVGKNGSWNAPALAGRVASESGIQLSSCQLVKVHKGGLYPTTAKDFILHKVVEVDQEEEKERPLSSLSTTSTSSKEDDVHAEGKHQWTDNAVKLLLASYSEHRGKFQSPCVRKHEVWKAISADLIEKGFLACTAEGCEKKFSNMKIRYKKIVDNNSATGRATWRWPYFDAMQELLGNDPSVVPPVIVSSLSGAKVYGSTPMKRSFAEMEQLILTPPAATPLPPPATPAPATPVPATPVPIRHSAFTAIRQTATAPTFTAIRLTTPPPTATPPATTAPPASAISSATTPASSQRQKRTRRQEPPAWFKEWATQSSKTLQDIASEMKRKNDLIEKLIERMNN